MKEILKRLLFLSLLIYLGFGLILFIFQKNYFYYPTSQDFSSCQEFSDSEILNIDGTRAYLKKNSLNLVVFYHGNAGSACDRSFLKNEFDKLNVSYIFVEYTGYSNDSEKPSKKDLMKDVENVNKFLSSQHFETITLAGESLGASLAMYHSSITKEDKLLLIAPFYKAVDVAEKHYGIYPISLMLTENYDNSKWINDLKNVLIIHGAEDEIIPVEQSETLFNKIRANNKKRILIEGAHHNDIYYFPETYLVIRNYLTDKTEDRPL